jgi:hypothetical protein
MTPLVRQVSQLMDRWTLVSRLAWAAAVPAATASGAPRVAAAARRRRTEPTNPEACGEFCAPASPCHFACGCGALNCFICNGCGDVNAVKCFARSCASGFCWKPTC